MPTTPTRTKKALQEMARVFNKLASELTADLNQAIREIETLKHEVQRLKANRTSPNQTNRHSKTPRKTNNRRAQTPKTHTPSTHTPNNSPTSSDSAHHTSHRETSKPTHESPYVFPQEPYNPQAPPEPSAPGNNYPSLLVPEKK